MKRSSRFNKVLCVLALVAVGAIGWAGTAQAAGTTFTWTKVATDGNWSDTPNWSGGVAANGDGNTANFSTLDIAADNTVILDTPVTIGNIIFGDTIPTTPAGWTLSGNTLTLAGTTPTITVNALGTGDVRLGTGKTATISAQIAGIAGLTKAGDGTLRLTDRANPYTGGTTVLAGTLNPVSGNNTFSFGGSLTMADGTTFLPDSGGSTMTVSDAITLTGGKVTFVVNNAVTGANSDLVLNCAIGGDGGIIVTGSNPVNGRRFELLQANTFAGGVTLKPSTSGTTFFRLEIYTPTSLGAGTLRSELLASTRAGLEVGSSVGYTPADLYTGSGVANDIDLASGANLNVTTYIAEGGVTSRDMQLSGVISGSGSLTKYSWSYQNNHKRYGEGTLLLSGDNTYTGETRIFRGILSVSSLNSVATNPGLGTVHSASSSLGAPTTPTAGTITFGRVIEDWADSAGALKGFAGTLLYTGGGETTDRVISLNGGTGGAFIDQSGTGLLKFTSDLTAPGTDLWGGSWGGIDPASLTDNRKTLTLQGSTDGAGEIAGKIVDSLVGTAGQLTTSVVKDGTGTWTLSGANIYTGTTTVTGGTLLVNNTSGSGTSTGAVTVNTGATLGGTGTIAGAVILIGGTLAPGAIAPGAGAPGAGADMLSVGTVAAPTDVTMDASAIYQWEFGETSADKVAIQGSLALDIDWNLVLVDAGGTPYGNQKYDLFTCTGALNLGLADIDFSGVPWDTTNARIDFDGVPGAWRVYITGLGSVVGDINNDGVVDAADYIILKQNFGGSTAIGENGDFDKDGKVEWDDLQTLLANFSTRSVGGAPPVPEPGSVMLLMFGAAALLRRRQVADAS